MKANNRKKQNVNPKMGLLTLLLHAFTGNGMDEDKAYRQAFHYSFAGGAVLNFPQKSTQ